MSKVRQIQLGELSLLEKYIEICTKHNLRYYALGLSLIHISLCQCSRDCTTSSSLALISLVCDQKSGQKNNFGPASCRLIG